MWDMTHSNVWHDSFIRKLWFWDHHPTYDPVIHVYDVTHLYVGHDLFICVTWLIHPCALNSRSPRAPQTNLLRDVTRSNVGHESFTCVQLLVHVRDTTHSYVGHDLFTRVKLLVHTRDMTHSSPPPTAIPLPCVCVWHTSHPCDISQTYVYAWHDSYTRDMTQSLLCHDLEITPRPAVKPYNIPLP